MSTVEVDICNSAMIKIGADLISDFSDNSKEARLCAHQYPRVLAAVLRSAPWSFAVKRAKVNPIVTTLEFGDESLYPLPADCVKVWKLYKDTSSKYSIEGRNLVSGEIRGVAEFFYISKAIAPAEFDASFQEAVACALAADLAFPMTQSDSLKQGLLQQAEFYINQARSYNSQEGTPENFTFDSFLNARMGGGANEIY